MQLMAPEHRFRTAVKHGWRRLLSATRPSHRFASRRRDRPPIVNTLVSIDAAPAAMPTPLDPVVLTVLAVNRLGPATLRTVANGKPLTVTVPNARVGDVFRAALAEMQKTRCTDRLIEIIVADDAGGAARRLQGVATQ